MFPSISERLLRALPNRPEADRACDRSAGYHQAARMRPEYELHLFPRTRSLTAFRRRGPAVVEGDPHLKRGWT